METTTNQNEQDEISLRTLASDIRSIEHGATAPVSESLKVTPQAPTDEDLGRPSPVPRKTARTIFLIIILTGIVAAFYFYVYPMLRTSIF